MNAVQLSEKDRFKLWAESVKTAMFWMNGVTKTRWEHAEHSLHSWTKNCWTFGETGTVKEGKQGKVLDRGETMMFVGYNQNHGQNSYRMYNPKSSRVSSQGTLSGLVECFFPKETQR